MKWKIDTQNHTGFINVTLDSESLISIVSSIELNNWRFSKTLELKNKHLQLSWNVNRQQKTGEIVLSRDTGLGSPTLSFAIEHDGWVLDDTLQFNNNYLKLIWQLPTQTNPHAQLGLITDGGELFHNTISVIDNNVELFYLGFGIQTDDQYIFQITNSMRSIEACRHLGTHQARGPVSPPPRAESFACTTRRI